MTELNADYQRLAVDHTVVVQWQCFHLNYMVGLCHVSAQSKAGEIDWVLMPLEDNSPNMARCIEPVTAEQVKSLLLCLVAEYAEYVRQQQNEEVVAALNQLRDKAIDTLNKFFPFAEGELTEIRLNGVRSNIYQQMAQPLILWRMFFAGRLFQFFAERGIDKAMIEQEDSTDDGENDNG